MRSILARSDSEWLPPSRVLWSDVPTHRGAEDERVAVVDPRPHEDEGYPSEVLDRLRQKANKLHLVGSEVAATLDSWRKATTDAQQGL